MTKAELVDKLADKVAGITKKEAEIIVNAFFDSIKDALASKDKVEVRGFGSFQFALQKRTRRQEP